MEEEEIEDENDSLNQLNKMSVGDEVEIELSQQNNAQKAYADDKECGEDIYKSEYYSLNYDENKDKSSQQTHYNPGSEVVKNDSTGSMDLVKTRKKDNKAKNSNDKRKSTKFIQSRQTEEDKEFARLREDHEKSTQKTNRKL